MENSRFTNAEGGTRLVDVAHKKNILVAEHTKFVATRLLHEQAYKIRGSLMDGKQRSVYVTRSSRVKCVAYDFVILTDLKILAVVDCSDVEDWHEAVEVHEVLVCTSEVFQNILKEEILTMKDINVLILDSCHLIKKDAHLKYIMKLYKACEENSRPRCLALTYPLFSHDNKNKNHLETVNEKDGNQKLDDIINNLDDLDIVDNKNVKANAVEEEYKNTVETKDTNKVIEINDLNDDDFEMYEKLEWKINTLEHELSCEADFAEDIDNIKRLSTNNTKPKELIIEYSHVPDFSVLSEEYVGLETLMKEAVSDVMEFLNEHRYDPTEIYGEDMYEELKGIPDPTLEPKKMFQQFLYVLQQLGPYGADKAAFTMLNKLEKLKIKVPYERHFLLLCLCTTVFIKIRCAADGFFEKYDNEWERIKRFCTPKILRFTEILCRFKPPADGTGKDMKAPCSNLLNEINKCDFNTLGNKLEDHINTIKCDLKEIPTPPRKVDRGHESKVTGKRPRTRGRVRPQRSNLAKLLQMQANPDALCGVVFIQQPLMAKVLFLIIVDLSRSHKDLSYICAQYSAGTAVDDVTDTKQFEVQRKKQEDVLKKFRMHECNLLLATSALEEGIDLPRCNLVLRWDVPSSYKSYGLCRDRARATRAVNIVMTSADKAATQGLVANIATYRELDQIICRKCGCGIQNEPPVSEEQHADKFTPIVKPYTPAPANNNNNKHLHEFNNKKKAESSTYRCNKCAASNVECKCEVKSEELASVDLGSAISLINRYCGKLPSDTFTRLAPQWWVEEVMLPVKIPKGETRKAYICTLRLPLNCPIKYNIVGHPMPTQVLARRMVALQACRILHKSGELDNQLNPIGKENFKAMDNTNPSVAENTNEPNDLARPGTTKRRQYYYKRTAWAFTDCQPVIDTEDCEISQDNQDAPKAGSESSKEPGKKHNVLYALVSRLWCSLPERYNTRGRRLHAPQHAKQALGILTARLSGDSFQIPAFPVYTRSGEIRVSVEPVHDADVRLSPRRGRLVRRFMRFIFAEVLRVRRRGMKLQTEGQTHNNYYVVPTIRKTKDDGTSKIDIDWEFLELIYQHTEERKHSDIEKPVLWHQDEEEEEDIKKSQKNTENPENNNPNIISKEICNKNKTKNKQMVNPLLKNGEVFVFDPEKYKEAVVTPWYRNQDLPQFFLVAEICTSLSPDSPFPSATHTTFRDYYTAKYCVPVTQPAQPLLDVDHTSARLNLLTPRYVNRKGVALPVSSERTRRAKRDRLDQKQILVPELCRVHPFAAPLWSATVALPCVLYRINALLIADEIRRCVAIDVGLGIPKINEETCPGFEWPPLDFGWSLAEVLSLDAEKEKTSKKDLNKDSAESPLPIEAAPLAEQKTEADELMPSADVEDAKEKTLNDILQEKEDAENGFEIGTWTNDMASSIPTEYDEEYNAMEPLPPNLTFCTSASGGTNWSDMLQNRPTNKYSSGAFSVANSDCSYMSSDFDTDDSDLDSMYSDEDANGFCSSKNTNAAMGIRIEYKTAHEAEAVDLRREKKTNLAPEPDAEDDHRDRLEYHEFLVTGDVPHEYKEKFQKSVEEHKKEIQNPDFLIQHDVLLNGLLPEIRRVKNEPQNSVDKEIYYNELFPYESDLNLYNNGEISLENIEINKRKILNDIRNKLKDNEVKEMNCFSMKDVNIDADNYVNEKLSNIGFDDKAAYEEKANSFKEFVFDKEAYFQGDKAQNKKKDFDFDYQPKLEGHPGPSPSVILQALTMSNANDGINLERLETIGDSFLKFAITAYLYCAHPTVHEGKLSHMRSKQVSNLSLYRLGRNKRLGARMIASKFEPHDNWLPPCHKPPPTLGPKTMSDTQSHQAPSHCLIHGTFRHNADPEVDKCTCFSQSGCFIPYNLITQHSIPDKSLADCVEALIGAYLIETGPRGALLFMSWLGIQVLPKHNLKLSDDHPYVRREMSQRMQDAYADKQEQLPQSPKKYFESSESDDSWSEDEHVGPQQTFYEETSEYENWSWSSRMVGSTRPVRDENGQWSQTVFGELKAPPSPLLRYIDDPEGELHQMLSGYEALERTLQYRFKDRSLLLQALTHASHHQNRLTDCYQRLEFLGDAILDYLITRYLYEDERRHSPGALTDLRSALVNNTIFATLAVRHGFHKYFRHMSPGLNEVLTKYVKIQDENGHSISEEHYLIQEDEMEQAEDVEVPKALGDLFESVAGAIFLDSDMSLGAVWRSYVNLMGAELEAFSACAPKSPVRELLEAEPDTAKFGKPERLADGRRVRVCVEVFGRGTFKGIGRNYRIAKGTAARCALRHLKKVYRS